LINRTRNRLPPGSPAGAAPGVPFKCDHGLPDEPWRDISPRKASIYSPKERWRGLPSRVMNSGPGSVGMQTMVYR